MATMIVLVLCCCLAVVSCEKQFFRPEGGRPVFPLVAIGGPAPAPAPGPGPVAPAPAPGPGPVAPSPGGAPPPRAFEGEQTNYVESNSGKLVQCSNNADCYGYREPDDWCPLPSGGVYRDRGCWCDRAIGDCVIDRIVSGAKQWAWCTNKGVSRC